MDLGPRDGGIEGRIWTAAEFSPSTECRQAAHECESPPKKPDFHPLRIRVDRVRGRNHWLAPAGIGSSR
jgi:hypothetical protein